MKRLAFITGLLIAMASNCFAQTVVYKCSKTGNIGYCHGLKAKACAYQKCLQTGGINPVMVYNSPSKDFGSIAVGKDKNGGTAIGVSTGCANKDAAQKRALEECRKAGGNNVHIKEWWEDK